MLEFNIRNQEISRIDNFSPAEKSVEYLIAKFNFKTEDWNEAIKRAIFRNAKSKMEKDTMIEDDSCVVPWEVLVGSGDIEVSVHGVIGTEEITTDVAVFNLNRTLSGGSATQEPSPTVYEQMVEMVKDAKEVAQSVRDDADNGKFSGIPGEKGEDGKSAYDYAVEGGFEGTEAEFTDLMGKPGGVDLTGYVTKEEHDAELLKAMVKVTTDKAPFHHITDSANMKVVDFGMEGITEQDTVPGNQLFDVSKYVSNSTSTNNGDGSITITRYAAESTNKLSDLFVGLEVGKTIICNMKNAGLFVYFGNTPKEINKPFEITQDMLDNNRFGFYGKTDTSVDNPLVISDIMFNEGTTTLPVEEYVGGMPSPNPEHEEEITLAGVYNEEIGRYEHKCCVGNKNLFDKSTEQRVSNNAYYHRDKPLLFKANYPYTLTIYNVPSSITIDLIHLNSVENAILKASYKTNKLSFTLDEDVYGYIRMTFNGAGSDLSFLDDCTIQLEINPSATDYTPHASQPFTLTSDRPLTMWDKLVKRDGVWGWSTFHKIRENIQLANETIADAQYGAYARFYIPSIKAFAGAEGKCDSFRVNTSHSLGDNICGFFYGEDFCIVKSKESLGITDEDNADSRIEKLLAYMSDKPFKLIHQTSTEQAFIPLPDEEQTLLNNLETYYGVTNVYNEQGCPMWFKYCADQELHWNQKLLQIQQAII